MVVGERTNAKPRTAKRSRTAGRIFGEPLGLKT
jgi:hypothetical protein